MERYERAVAAQHRSKTSGHDIRNVLAIARGYIELAKDYGEPLEVAKVESHLAKIRKHIGENDSPLLGTRQVMAKLGFKDTDRAGFSYFVKKTHLPRIKINARLVKYDPKELDKWLARREQLGRAHLFIRSDAKFFRS